MTIGLLEEKKCLVCKKKFYVPTKNVRRRFGKNIRQRQSLTCSPKCSREYNRRDRNDKNRLE